MSGFHLFPFLQWEIRRKIWKYTMRPDLPGVHVFRLYDADDSVQLASAYDNDETKEAAHRDAKHKDSEVLDGPLFGPHFRLAAPRCLPCDASLANPTLRVKVPISWTHNNPSTYIVDGGLWTACEESKRVMEEAIERDFIFLPNKSAALCPRAGKRCGTTQEILKISVPPTKSIRYINLQMEPCDLFILQIDDIKSLRWENLRGPWIPANIAFEYKPDWEREGYRDVINDFFRGLYRAGAAEDSSLDNIWFIDYRIKRKHHAQTEKQALKTKWSGPQVFYGSDRRYVEVKGYYKGYQDTWDDDRSWDDVFDGRAESMNRGVHDFARCIYDDLLEAAIELDPDLEYDRSNFFFDTRVLAYEEEVADKKVKAEDDSVSAIKQE
ncbi:hypothetical protein OQA88_10266 [Cercophora sp. LCS_1]